MKKTILILVVFATACAYAQPSRYADSLLQLLEKEKTDSNRLKLYRQAGSYYMDNNAAKAISYFESAIELGRKINRPLAVANGYYDIGFCYLITGDYDRSLENYQQSVRHYEEMKDDRRLANAFMSIGNVYGENGDYKKTSEYFDKARVLIEKRKDSTQLASLYSERGNLFNREKQYDSGLIFLERALLISRQRGDSSFLANTLVNIGLNYKHLDKPQKALLYMDSAFIIYKKMPDMPPDMWGAFYNNLAATHAAAGRFNEAVNHFNTSIMYAQKAGSPSIEMENYRNLADMYGNMNNDRQQLLNLKKYYTLKDSVFSADNKIRLTQLEADYQVEKSNALVSKKEAQIKQQRNQRNIFIVVTCAVAAILGGLTWFYSRIRRNNKLLQERNTEIERQKEALQNLNQVKDRLFSIISHDLRSPLISLHNYLGMSTNTSLDASQKEYFRQHTLQAVSQTSNMLDNLLAWANLQLKNTPANITPLELADQLQDAASSVAAQAQQKNIAIEVQPPATVALSNEAVLQIVLRNLLTNAVKFSKPGGRVRLGATVQNNEVHIEIQDDGVGMPPEAVQNFLQKGQTDSTTGTGGEKGTGLGLFLVKELLEKTKGRMMLNSEQGRGTVFTVVLPVG
jgi:signal transduction histidine kinase